MSKSLRPFGSLSLHADGWIAIGTDHISTALLPVIVGRVIHPEASRLTAYNSALVKLPSLRINANVRQISPEPVPELHELLDAERQHMAVWDIVEPHLMARRVTSRGSAEPISMSILGQPATRPAVRDMRIISDFFPWEILIRIPRSVTDKVVTVGLVLEAIHGVMQESMDPEDWETLGTPRKKKVYLEMCMRLSMAEPSMQANVQALKIDCLLGKTEFMGLKRTGQGEDDTWSLFLGPPVD